MSNSINKFIFAGSLIIAAVLVFGANPSSALAAACHSFSAGIPLNGTRVFITNLTPGGTVSVTGFGSFSVGDGWPWWGPAGNPQVWAGNPAYHHIILQFFNGGALVQNVIYHGPISNMTVPSNANRLLAYFSDDLYDDNRGSLAVSGSACGAICSQNSDCGVNAFIGSTSCVTGNINVFQNYTTNTCNNPGTLSATCTSSTNLQQKTLCTGSQSCFNGSCAAIACTQDSNCGVNGFVSGPYCQGGNVYKDYKTYTCSNAGTASATCANSTQAQLQQTCSFGQICSSGSCVAVACNQNSNCGTNGYTGSPTCQSGNVYQNYTTYTCNNPGTIQATCTNASQSQLKTTCASGQTCNNGSCAAVACSTSSDCGTNGYIGSPVCQFGNVYQNYTTYTCNNAGTANATCSNSSQSQLKTTCANGQTCNNGSCAPVACNNSSDCGTSGYTGSLFCQSGNVYQNYTTYACNNPGTANAQCANSTQAQQKTVCSGGQTCSNGNCSLSCTNHSYQKCVGNSVYWFDSCNNQQDISQNCSSNQTCSNNSCISSCSSQSYKQCSGNNVYWYDSCGNQQGLYQTCFGNQTCSNGNCINSCASNSYQKCVGNSVYWFDSCNNQQSLYQICQSNQTCSNNSCITTNTCTNHSYQKCVGNSVYWFDSCNNQQDLYQSCSANQGCFNNSCVATNLQQKTLISTETARNLSSGALNWSQSISASPADILQFKVLIQSNTNQTVNNVIVKEVFPPNLYYKDNLTLDNVPDPRDITQGVNIGSILPGQTRTITYWAEVGPSQNFSFGTTTLHDPVDVTSTDPGFTPPITNTVTILVTVTGVQGATNVSTGLTNNFWVDSFFLPLLLAFLVTWVFRSGIFGVPEWVNEKQTKHRDYLANKQLQNKIRNIKKREDIM